MMYCGNCGVKIDEDGKFCKDCGWNVPAENHVPFTGAFNEEFIKTNNSIKLDGGLISPVAITFKKDSAGNYQIAEYWTPEQGDKFIPSIRNKFPQECWNAINTGFYTKALQANTMKQAQVYFK